MNWTKGASPFTKHGKIGNGKRGSVKGKKVKGRKKKRGTKLVL